MVRLWELALVAAAVLLCQAGVFYFQVWRCQLQLPDASDDTLTVLVVADVHLLGKRRRSFVERLWVDWQVHTAARAAVDVHSPEVALVLGDQFDEGSRWTPDADWDEYAGRFFRAFASFLPLKTLYLVGNHDTSFGRDMQLQDLKRFEVTFGSGNRIDEIQGHTFVSLNTMALDSDVASPEVRTEARSFLKVSTLTTYGRVRAAASYYSHTCRSSAWMISSAGKSGFTSRATSRMKPRLQCCRATPTRGARTSTPTLWLWSTLCRRSRGDSAPIRATRCCTARANRPEVTACHLPQEPFIFATYAATAAIVVLAHVVRLVNRLRAPKAEKAKGS
ncbi:Metallo-dependent phosphatase-like [Phytophthora cactorum]|nr:Metallo-dependent phosphatase-like [Phytophthora cactorum]